MSHQYTFRKAAIPSDPDMNAAMLVPADLMVLIYPGSTPPPDVIDILNKNHALGLEVASYSQWISYDTRYTNGLICVRDDGTWMTVKGHLEIDAVKSYVASRLGVLH